MPSPPDVQLALDARAVNGEGAQWDDRTGRLFWVDMRGPSLNALDPDGGRNRRWDMPDWIGCYGLREDGRVVAALRTGVHLFDPEDGSLRMLAPAPYDVRRFCFNDGGCDRQGRFLSGPMYHALGPEDLSPDASRTQPLWRFDGVDRVEPLPLPPAKTANGLAFSPDGRTLYRSDTPTKTVWACDYEPETGAASNPRVFATVEEGGDDGGPDGAVVDRDGFYTCAVFHGGALLRFDPAGRLERRIPLPVDYPTMPALGGPDRATLFVTSASYPVTDREAHPWAGGVLALEAPAPGLPTSYMPAPKEPQP